MSSSSSERKTPLCSGQLATTLVARFLHVVQNCTKTGPRQLLELLCTRSRWEIWVEFLTDSSREYVAFIRTRHRTAHRRSPRWPHGTCPRSGESRPECLRTRFNGGPVTRFRTYCYAPRSTTRYACGQQLFQHQCVFLCSREKAPSPLGDGLTSDYLCRVGPVYIGSLKTPEGRKTRRHCIHEVVGCQHHKHAIPGFCDYPGRPCLEQFRRSFRSHRRFT